MSWSVELADAFQELHDLFADKLDATTDEERQELDNKIEFQKAQVKENEDLQQHIMRDLQPDSPEGGLPRNLAALWSRLLDATVRWKNPSAEERKDARSELDILRHIFRRVEHRDAYS